MCGRYVIATPPGQLALDFGAEVDETLAGNDVRENWNTAPTHTVPILLERVDEHGSLHRELHAARWGLVPSWAKEISVGARMFNARSETVLEKPSFRAAVKSRRCAIPANGYYEWQASSEASSGRKGKKQPFFVHPPEGRLIWFAGIYEWWRIPEGQQEQARAGQSRESGKGTQWLLSCSMLTCEAPEADDPDGHLAALGALHHRLPMGLAPDFVADWISPEPDAAPHLVAEAVSRAHEVAATWRMHPVGSEVGSVSARGPQLAQPLDTLL